MSQTSNVSKSDAILKGSNEPYMDEMRKVSQGDSSTDVIYGDDDDDKLKENANSISPPAESQDSHVLKRFGDHELKQLKSSPSIKESTTDDQDVSEIRKKYNPRTSFSGRPNNIKVQLKEKHCKNLERGENPVDPTQMEMSNDDFQKENPQYCQRIQNHVMDYRKLRKSGYFLKNNQETGSKINLMATKSIDFAFISKTSLVENWLESLPENCVNERYSDENLGDPMQSLRMPSFMSEEDELKSLLLNRASFMKYTSEPAPTLTCSQLESLLETANAKIDNFLTKFQLTPQVSEHEYVCGKIEIPSFLRTNDDNKKKFHSSNEPSGDSWLERLATWLLSILKRQDKNHSDSGMNKAKGCCVILEPYHGPVAVNGSVIESGATKLILRKGTLGTIVEEIKAALQAINDALRKLGSPKKSSSITFPHTQRREDPEIRRLTKMLLDKGLRKKSKFRTVFGVRNVEKIPTYSLTYRRRRRMPHRRGGFFRAVNGWIQRKTIGQDPVYRRRFI